MSKKALKSDKSDHVLIPVVAGEISEFGRQFFWNYFQKSQWQVKCENYFYVDPENFMKNI